MPKKPIIEEQHITDTLETNYMPYAMSVIVSRAIPEIDGFKPSHRKLLYTMYKMGLLNGAKTKSANVVGQTMKLNPHGDAAIYETMVRLTAGHQALLYPLVESKGNFGRQYSRDMAYAAPRYTEVKLSNICTDVFKDIEKNTTDMVDNYDGTLKEPLLLPVAFPNILVNPNQGIAVGMASNICSFNLGEICNATIKLIKNPDADITDVLLAPDFSTGGQIIYNGAEMSEIYRTGRGAFKIRGKYRYDKKANCVDIYEIPYTTTVEAIMEKIIDLVKSGSLKEVSDIRDETDLNGLKLTIDLKRGVDHEKLMTKIYKMTTLQDSFACNFNILVEGSPMVLGVNDIICEWLRFRRSCIKRSIQFDIGKKSERLHLLEGLEKILLDIDKAIKIVRNTEEDSMVVPNLMKGFGIDEVQAEYVAEIKLRNLNKEYILKRTADIKALMDELAELNSILNDPKKVDKVIEKQLKELSKKYSSDRQSEIITADSIKELPEEHFIDNYAAKIFRTKQNYLKKISLVSLRTSGEQKLKENDELAEEIEISNRYEVLAFSSSGDVYKIKAYDIPDCKASQLGEYMPNIFNMGEGENIIGMVATEDFKGYVLFCFENGKVAKVELKSYETKLNRKKLSNAYYTKVPLVRVVFIKEDTELVAFSSGEKILAFNTADILAKTTKNTQGVTVLIPKKGCIMNAVKFPTETTLSDLTHYRAKALPARGSFLRLEDEGMQQMSLLDDNLTTEE